MKNKQEKLELNNNSPLQSFILKNSASEETQDLEILEHTDISFLVNHAIDDLESKFAEEEYDNPVSRDTPSFLPNDLLECLDEEVNQNSDVIPPEAEQNFDIKLGDTETNESIDFEAAKYSDLTRQQADEDKELIRQQTEENSDVKLGEDEANEVIDGEKVDFDDFIQQHVAEDKELIKQELSENSELKLGDLEASEIIGGESIEYSDLSQQQVDEDKELISQHQAEIPEQSQPDSTIEENNFALLSTNEIERGPDSSITSEENSTEILESDQSDIDAQPDDEKIVSENSGTTVEEESEFKSGAYKSQQKKKKYQLIQDQSAFQIGLDVGTQYIKYVITKKQKNGSQILSFGIVPNYFEKDEKLKQLTEYLIDELNIKKEYRNIRCSFNVYGQSIGIKRHTFPKMKAKMLQDAILWSAKKEFDLENVPILVDYVKLGKIEKKGTEHEDILMIACDENLVTEKIESLLIGKLVPFKVNPVAITLWQMYKKSANYNKDETVALIDIGSIKTTIVFINKGILEFNREIPTGGKDISESLTGTIFYDGRPFQFNYQEAEEMKLEYGFPFEELEDLTSHNVPVNEYSVLMRPILERLGSEIQRSIDYFQESFSDSRVDRIILLGGSSQLKNLITFLPKFIEPQLSLLQFPENIQHDMNEIDLEVFESRYREFAIAHCLATDYEKKPNLLPPSIQRLGKLQVLKRFSIYAVLASIILLGGFSGFSFVNIINLKSQFKFLQHEFSKLEPLKQKYDSLLQTQNYLNNKKQIYRRELILDSPISKTLKVVANLYPKNISVTSISIKNKGSDKKSAASKKSNKNAESETITGKVLKISGVCNNPKPAVGIEIANYLQSLEKTGLFKTILVENQDVNEEYNQLTFEIVCDLK